MKAILKSWLNADPKKEQKNYFIVEEIVDRLSNGKEFVRYKPVKRISNGEEVVNGHKYCEWTKNEIYFI